MTGHTPGPWHVRHGAPLFRPGSTNVISAGGDYIAEVGHIDIEHVEADARLIAAAPELLALAKKYAGECSGCNGSGKNDILRGPDMAWDTEPCPDCADIRAVIAKAVQQ